MKFFLILLTISSFAFKVFAKSVEVKIIATINSEVITTFDVKNAEQALRLLFPEMNKLDKKQQKISAMQHLVNNVLKREYVKRANLEISQEDVKLQTVKFQQTLQKSHVGSIKDFLQKHKSFIEDEIFWSAVVEKYIAPNVQSSNEVVAKIVNQNPKITQKEAEDIIIQQQVEYQTKQIINSIRQVSVVEINEEYFM